MPLFDAVRANQFRRQIEGQSYAAFRQVPLPPRYFAAPAGGNADLLFKRLDDGSGCILLIEAGVQYLGRDPALRGAFAVPARNGWRPLAILRPAMPEAVLRQADALLGLGGAEPRMPAAPEPKEIVVRAEELHRQGMRGRTDENDVERFGTDLVEEAKNGRLQPALFREKETEALLRILSKEGKNAVCLVGEAGVGKTKIVENLAIRIAQGGVPPSLQQARVLDVNLSFLAAGATYQNEFEGRLKQLLDLGRQDPNVILFLDEIHTIRAPGSNAAQMVKSDLGRGRIRCVGATTNAEFRLIETDAALARRFQVVPVPELSRDQTLEILRSYRERLERHHGVRIDPELLAPAVDLAIRYVPHRNLPDKALDLLDEACASARIEADRRRLT
jgi:ATP-dependent Clp protease ATP-binding subunit ClpA